MKSTNNGAAGSAPLKRLLDDFREYEAAVAQYMVTMKSMSVELRETDSMLTQMGQPSGNRVMRRLRDDDPKSVLAAARDIVARLERVANQPVSG